MSLLSWWRGRTVKLTDGAFWAQWFGGETWSGKTVTPHGAMQIAAWWACVRLIAETVATLPLGVFQKTTAGNKEPTPGHPLYRLLHDSPNADQTAAEFWEGVVASLCVFGNGYARKELESERLIALTPIPADVMVVRRDEQGVLRYKYTERGKTFDLTEREIFHVRGFGMGLDVGLSPVSYARQTLATAMAISEAAGTTFGQGMRASGFFISPQVLTKEQREQAEKRLVEKYSGSGAAGKAGLLEGGFTWSPASINPHDAEMLLSWKFSVEEICRWLRVPPVLIGHAAEGQTMWGSGVEQIMLGWLTLGLRPYLTRIEQSIKKQLIPAAERDRTFAEFNVDGLLRADSAGRAAMLSSLGQNGYLTRNEGRALDNRPPKPGGDVLTVQSNLVPLEQLGQTPPRAVQPAPGEPVP